MFIQTCIILVSLTTVHSSKCPEDPLACILKWQQSSSQFFSIKLQESTGEVDPLAPSPSDHQDNQQVDRPLQQEQQQQQLKQQMSSEVDTSVHVDGRFSLNDTQAAGCGDNQTTNGTNGCKKCSSCPKNGKIIRSCSSDQDTICMCERGTYLDILAYECKPCSPCAHGYGVWKKCNRHRDTVCRQCAPGFYSGVLSNDLSCSPCDTCTSNQIMLQECSRIENTVCIDRSIGKRGNYLPSTGLLSPRKEINGNNLNVSHHHLTQSGSDLQLKMHPHHNHHHQNQGPPVTTHGKHDDMTDDGEEDKSVNGHYYDYSTSHASLHMYFSILVVIICCVFFYVLLQRRLHQKAKSAPFKSPIGNIYIRPANVDNMYSPLPHPYHAHRQHQQLMPSQQQLKHQYKQLQPSKSPVNNEIFRSQSRKASKQQANAVPASDSHRLLGSNSPSSRPVQQQPQLVVTWTENVHAPSYFDASSNFRYLNSPYDERNCRHQRLQNINQSI